MKKQYSFTLLASVMMLVAMTFASCNSNNKTSATDAEQDSIPACMEGVVGVEKYQTKLDYFLTNLNQGRPFILAGHSQGSATLIALLENYMTKHPEALERMVAAYPIGYAVTKDFLARTGLKFAEGATDTGVIVSWNTEGKANVDTNAKNVTLAPGCISINPINWKRNDTYAPVSDNLGSLDVEGKLVTPGLADAQVDTVRGAVIVSTVDAKLYAIPADAADLFGPESYHLHDYGFFFNNLKQNVADRIKAFMEK